ncbi:hypothetical protein L6452_01127 [Arctium lappa]|uniref:Uncharacterized protein n=1 Tax=Arctium lappa TaxID=4217 RepID=A0ACB9FFF7_ARCLA|nr:hypothetical protein L6452_01127 [Arctium lappa]
MNMRQRRWLELVKDYNCELLYHPGKANVVADALSQKEYSGKLRAKLVRIELVSSIMDRIKEAQAKLDVAHYVERFVTCSQVKAEHQRPYGSLQSLEIPEWKWEKITMDFVTKLPKTLRGNDTIWVIVDWLTNRAHFQAMRKTLPMDKLAKLYIDEVDSRHGIPLSIVSDRDTRFTSRFCGALQQELRTSEFEYGIPPTDRRTERKNNSDFGRHA